MSDTCDVIDPPLGPSTTKNTGYRLVTFHHKENLIQNTEVYYRVSVKRVYYFSALQGIGPDPCNLRLQVKGRRLEVGY